MGLFSGITGGGGSAKRAAAVYNEKLRQAEKLLTEAKDRVLPQYQPYQQAGTTALDSLLANILPQAEQYGKTNQSLLSSLAGERSALVPQGRELYDVAKQQDSILAQILNPDVEAYKSTPGYEARRKAGIEAIRQQAALEGGLGSGELYKDLERFGQDYATSEYDNYLNRLYNQMGGVQSQLQSRQSALQGALLPINTGLGIASGQQSALQQLLNTGGMYQNLANLGYGATGDVSNIEMDTARQRGNLLTSMGATDANAMLEKRKQLNMAGENLLKLAASAASGAASGFAGGGGLAGAGTGFFSGLGSGFTNMFGGGQPQQGNMQTSALQSLTNYAGLPNRPNFNQSSYRMAT